MNKFIIQADALAGCGFWLFAFSIGAALVFLALVRLGGLAR